MRVNFALFKNPDLKSNLRFYIIFSWCCGLFLGLHIIPHIYGATTWRFAAEMIHRSGFVPLLIIGFAPIALSYLLYRHNRMWILPFLCFLKALFFGFVLFLLFARFSSATWLAQGLILFADSVDVCLFLWFCLRQSSGKNTNIRFDITILAAIHVLCCLFDSFILSPFLFRLF